MDCIDIIFSIKTLQTQVKYLLGKDEVFQKKGYVPDFSKENFQEIRKGEIGGKKKKSRSISNYEEKSDPRINE